MSLRIQNMVWQCSVLAFVGFYLLEASEVGETQVFNSPSGQAGKGSEFETKYGFKSSSD